jgi:hypothetical protein
MGGLVAAEGTAGRDGAGALGESQGFAGRPVAGRDAAGAKVGASARWGDSVTSDTLNTRRSATAAGAGEGR